MFITHGRCKAFLVRLRSLENSNPFEEILEEKVFIEDIPELLNGHEDTGADKDIIVDSW